MCNEYYQKNKKKIIEKEKFKYLKVKNDENFKKKRNRISTEYYYKNKKNILERKRRERHQTKFSNCFRILYFD
jgi:hypothetical protein